MAIINHKIYVFHLVVFIASVIDDVHFKGSSIYIMLLLDIENFSSLFFFLHNNNRCNESYMEFQVLPSLFKANNFFNIFNRL